MSPTMVLVIAIWGWIFTVALLSLVLPPPWHYLPLASIPAAFIYLFSDGVPWVFLHSIRWKLGKMLCVDFKERKEHVRPWLLRGAPIRGTLVQLTPASQRRVLYDKYRSELASVIAIAPEFAPPEGLLEHLADSYESQLFTPSSTLTMLEDYIEDTLRCERVTKWLRLLAKEKVSPLARRVMHELLFSVALVPACTLQCPGQLHPSFPVAGDLQRFAFSLFSRHLVLKLIKEVTKSARTGLRIVLLSHIKEECLEMPLISRWLAYSLMNYTPEVRAKMMKDPLWSALLDLPAHRQLLWVVASSGHLEQFFLNTCKTCAGNQGLVAHQPTAVNGLVLAEIVADLSAKSIAWAAWHGVEAYEATVGHAPPMETYLRSQIACTTTSLKQLRARTAQLLLDDCTPCTLHELFELTNDWSFVMQEMSVLWRPGLYLTVKPIADDWAASAKLMTLITALMVLRPGLPVVPLRARGSPRTWRHPHRLLEFSMQFKGKDQGLFFQAAWKLRIAAASDALLDELWCATLRLGGALVGSNDHIAGVTIGHLGFITAWRTPEGERVFLLSDPEYACYKMLNYVQMRFFVSHLPHATDFMAVD